MESLTRDARMLALRPNRSAAECADHPPEMCRRPGSNIPDGPPHELYWYSRPTQAKKPENARAQAKKINGDRGPQKSDYAFHWNPTPAEHTQWIRRGAKRRKPRLA